MAEITLFELHVPDAQFNAPFAGSSDATPGAAPESDPAGEAADDEFSSGSSSKAPVAILAAVVAFALLAWLARRSRRSSTDGEP